MLFFISSVGKINLLIITSICLAINVEDLFEIAVQGKAALFFILNATQAIYVNPFILSVPSTGNPLNDFLHPGKVVFVFIGGILV